ncbi:hypothetical protein NEOKW01_0490 [Nematocida sp. AWRm80]|nr:hypothetical protein NEOKW01_0490 [Nematocida sp. AWRm80]
MHTFRVYPVYFNGTITRSQGRRVPKGTSQPTLQEIQRIFTSLGIQNTPLKKEHPQNSAQLYTKEITPKTKVEEIERILSAYSTALQITSPENKRTTIMNVYRNMNK